MTTVERSVTRGAPLPTSALIATAVGDTAAASNRPYHSELPTNRAVLLLACDGLWDVFSNAEAIAETNILLEEGDSMEVISGKLLDASLAKGSKDNVTAVVVDLRGSKEAGAAPPPASAASLPVKYGRYGYPKQDFGFQGGR